LFPQTEQMNSKKETKRTSPCFLIGGELGISSEIFLQPELDNQDIGYDKKYHIYVDTGRSALFLALNGIIQQGGKRQAWLPYYCCESVILPFEQLGFDINYYSMGNNLQNPELLPERLNGAAFLFINYFGKKNYGITRYLGELDNDNSGFIIEDNVQALLSSNSDQYGDFIINSCRKFLPQPDGAVLACDIPIEYSLNPADESFISEKIIGKMIREKQGDPELFLALLNQAENRLSRDIQPRSMSYLSKYIFDRTDLKRITETRRFNWFYLSKLLKSTQLINKGIIPLYDSLEDSEVPLGFPITVHPIYRDKLRNYLISQNIFCPVHWPLCSAEQTSAYKNDIALSKSILTLPVDQRLEQDALSYMVEQILHFYIRM